jgi:monoterpene epsilon-lactone hydrolase
VVSALTSGAVAPSPEHEALVAGIVASGQRTPDEIPDMATIAAQRTTHEPLAPVPDGVRVVEVDAGGVPSLWVDAPDVDPSKVVVLFHGGGYVWLSARTHTTLAAQLSAACGARCLVVGYRQAPEHPYPAAVDDAVTVFGWLRDNDIAPSRTLSTGDSAGGGLAIAAVLALRDARLPTPAGIACFSPWTDLTVSGASAWDVDDPLVSGRGLKAMAEAYLAGADPSAPTASPLFADLRGLPPIHIQVGSREALLDDTLRFVERARAAGVDVTHVVHAGVIHMWVVFGPHLPETDDAVRRAADFARRCVGS